MLLVAAGLTAAFAARSIGLSWAIAEDGVAISWQPWTVAVLAFVLLGIPPWLMLPGRRALFLFRRHRRKNLPSKEAAEDPPPVRDAEVDPVEPQNETPRWRLSRALPIALTVIATGLWLGSFEMAHYWVERNAGSSAGFFAPAMRVAKHQLALRSVSIRRFVAANGRLPRSLSECDTDQRLLDMILFSKKKPKALPGFDPPILEPWAPYPYADANNDKRALTAQPPIEVDYLGLPLLYQPGKSRDGREGWIDASSSLPVPVHRYIELQGRGVPARSKLPYALSSVFVQWNIKTQQDHQRQVSIVRALQLGGLAGLLCGCLFVVLIWRGKPLRWFSWVGVALSAAFAVLFFTGALASQATCYAMSSFMSSRLKRNDRLAILEQAVAAGDVPREVAAKARRFINDLPTAE